MNQANQDDSSFYNDFLAKKAELAVLTNAANANEMDRLLVNPENGLEDYRYTQEYRKAMASSAPKQRYSGHTSGHTLEAWDGKGASFPPTQAEINRKYAYDTWHYKQASNLSQSLPVLGGATSGSMILNTELSTRMIVGIGTVAGGGFEFTGQYVDTKGFSNGDWRPMQTFIAAASGGVSAPLSFSSGLIGNIALRAGVSVANAEFGNFYYQNDSSYKKKDLSDLGWEALKGSIGGGGYFFGRYTANLLTQPINPSISILFQNYKNPYPALVGNSTGAIVSGSAPVVLDNAKNLYLPQQDKYK